jgi:putative two-component system response regulator
VLSSALGRSCGLPETELRFLQTCARFHDIGKIGIPDRILQKPGKLTPEEYAIIKQHTEIGGNIIRNILVPNIESLAHIVEHHHERYDGKGYPAGLIGDNTPLLSRIIAIVDTYDAITSRRSYREANTSEYALECIASGRGTQFDPELSDLFLPIAEHSDPQFIT